MFVRSIVSEMFYSLLMNDDDAVRTIPHRTHFDVVQMESNRILHTYVGGEPAMHVWTDERRIIIFPVHQNSIEVKNFSLGTVGKVRICLFWCAEPLMSRFLHSLFLSFFLSFLALCGLLFDGCRRRCCL